MKRYFSLLPILCTIIGIGHSPVGAAESLEPLAKALTLHASFDQGFDADYSVAGKASQIRGASGLVPTTASEELQLQAAGGRYGGCLHFPKKGNTRPQFAGEKVLNYTDKGWNTTVSVWLRLDPDKDLEPGYCDPVQIVGNDSKKGFVFLEWSKDETPRYFRFAIRPLFHLWNPTDVKWDQIPFEQRPMVQIAGAPFSRESWTHVVFTIAHINEAEHQAVGRLYLNGELQGEIKDRDLTFGWDPKSVLLILGAAYVGHLDDLAVFNRALNREEVRQLYTLPMGIHSLRQ